LHRGVTVLLAVGGSLQVRSSNRGLLELAARLAPATGAELVPAPSVGTIPHFDPDVERDGVPPAVADWRARVQAADGVLLASPEYAHGIPGSLKNALDWLVGSGDLYDSPVAVLSASPRPNGSTYLRSMLEETLRAQGARVVASTTVTVPTGTDVAAEPLGSPIARAVRDAVEALREAAVSRSRTW
jgi:NAD(P)H-dependent FMN reductase